MLCVPSLHYAGDEGWVGTEWVEKEVMSGDVESLFCFVDFGVTPERGADVD